jgi:CHAD domain-containing protein
MDNRPLDLVRMYGTEVIKKYLSALQAEIEGVRSASDIEHIHRMRVSSRRLRSAMPLFINYFPNKKFRDWVSAIRGITRALGAARDTDVQIAYLQDFLSNLSDPRQKTGIRRLLLRLRQQREAFQTRVVRALDRLQKKGTLAELNAELGEFSSFDLGLEPVPSDLYLLACRSIEKCLVDFLAHEQYISDPDNKYELHQMRICAKRLRYTQEIFAQLYQGKLQEHIDAVRKCQDLLGEIHDLDVWQLNLPIFLEEEKKKVFDYCGSSRTWKLFFPGIEILQFHVHEKRVEKYTHFLLDWQIFKQKNTWDSLLQTVRQPVQVGAIYPPSQFPTEVDQDQPSLA